MKNHWISDPGTADRLKRPASVPAVAGGVPGPSPRPRMNPQATSCRPPGASPPILRHIALRRPLTGLGLLLLIAPVLLAQPPEDPTQAAAQPPEATSGSVVADSPRPGLYRGPVSCASSTCHGATEPREVFDVLQNEYLTWLQRDRHSKAHEVLVGPDSRRIAANLGLDQPAENAPLCLDCHAFEPPEEQVVGRVEREQGISCEACHGPASGWLGPHTEEGWTTEDGVAAGLIDLSDPIRRGELCLSCHRGEGDRVVDHRLIAAGHPQLLFELDNFSGDMPSHWRADPQADGARGWALGQVLALREELELIAASADAGRWPELSLMACDDCHHSLEEERWRRGVQRPLGLPEWSPAKWAVTRHLVRRFAPGQEAPLDRALGRLARNVSRLGAAPSEAAEAARAARAVLDEVVPAVRDTQWKERQIKALLVSLAEDRQALAGADRDTALQAFLAVNSLASDLINRNPSEVLQGGLFNAVEALHRTIDDPYRYRRNAFAAGLERVGREVRRLR